MRAILLSVAALTASGHGLLFEVRHDRVLKDHPGPVTIDETGVEHQQVLTPKQQARAAKGKRLRDPQSPYAVVR
jgi:hypothetical protein